MSSIYLSNAIFMMIILTIIFLRIRYYITWSQSKKYTMIFIGMVELYVLMDALFMKELLGKSGNLLQFKLVVFFFYLVYVIMPYVWHLFMQSYMGINRSKKQRFAEMIPFILLVLMVLLSVPTGIVWRFSRNRTYIRGTFFGVFAVLNLFYYVYTFAQTFFILFMNNTKGVRYLIKSALFSAVPLIGILANTYIIPLYGAYPFQPYCLVIGALLSYLFMVEHQQDQMEFEHRKRLSKALELDVDLVGYAVLPSGNTIQDYTDLISYLENGDICITGGILELQEHAIKPVRLLTVEILDELTELQRQTGIYANEIGNKELREITWSNICNTAVPSKDLQMLFQKVKPKTYRDMVALESGIHSTFRWQNGQQGYFDVDKFIEMTTTNDFKIYPCFTREDFYDYMIENGVDCVKAYEAFECIRKGYAVSVKHDEEWMQLEIPEGIKNVAKNYRYVFPRAHCIGYVLGYAKLAYYAKVDGKMFSRVVFGKK